MTILRFIRNAFLVVFTLGFAPLSPLAQVSENRPSDESEFSVQVSPEAAKAMREATGSSPSSRQSQSIESIKSAAAQGGAEAQYKMGMAYAHGTGVEESDERARVWFRKAAEQNHAESMYRLATQHHVGWGGPQSKADAAYWYGRAAELGQMYAQYNLGNFYRDGIIVPKDTELAASWYFKAAAQGHEASQDAYDELTATSQQSQSGPSARETGELIGILLRYLADRNETSGRSNSNSSSVSNASGDPEQAVCRAEASRHITECALVPDDCNSGGCWDMVMCDRRSWCVSQGSSPYGRRGIFYCDIKHRGNLDFDREVVLADACNGKFD